MPARGHRQGAPAVEVCPSQTDWKSRRGASLGLVRPPHGFLMSLRREGIHRFAACSLAVPIMGVPFLSSASKGTLGDQSLQEDEDTTRIPTRAILFCLTQYGP
jgi:hypothetical protein